MCFLTLPLVCTAQERIAFTSNRDDGNFEIYVMNADGTNQTRVTNNPALDQCRDGRNSLLATLSRESEYEGQIARPDSWR